MALTKAQRPQFKCRKPPRSKLCMRYFADSTFVEKNVSIQSKLLQFRFQHKMALISNARVYTKNLLTIMYGK